MAEAKDVFRDFGETSIEQRKKSWMQLMQKYFGRFLRQALKCREEKKGAIKEKRKEELDAAGAQLRLS